MRVVFMGTPDFAVPALLTLIGAEEVVGVVTQPDKRRGRGKAVAFSPVKKAALAHDIPVFQPEKVREEAFVQTLRQLEPDVIVVAAFGQILPESILTLPRYGCLNIHASLLPKYRGAAPIQWAVINGEKETGVTIMYMEKGLDTGDMIDRAVVSIDPYETGASLHDKLSVLGGPLVVKTLRRMEEGTVPREKQDDKASSYAPMLTRDTGRIRWTQSADRIERLVRGLNPWPSAFTMLDGKTFKIWESFVDDMEGDAPAGTILDVAKDAFVVQTGKGSLRVTQVQLQGKKRMPVQAFLLGYPLRKGMILGDSEQDG